MNKIVKPLNPLVFETALALAATWYEVGRSQGLKSKWPTARLYAKANVEKYVSKAVKHLLEILKDKTKHDVMRAEIYEALIDVHNNYEKSKLPDINVKRLDDIVKQHMKNKIDISGGVQIKPDPKASSALSPLNPFFGEGY